jgi:glycosyltransferase involved in cell wall biosynthesis
MTSFALKKMVIATRVGSFSEYIDDNLNGLLSEADSNSIAQRIIDALDRDRYLQIENRINSEYSAETGNHNAKTFLEAYQAD